MSDYVIKVENLGKSYQIRHKQERYTALRDVLADGAKNAGRTLLRRNHHSAPETREEFWALNDVSFEVKQGERLGIIGRNGAGKSTLLKVLSRITQPTRGEVRLRGRVASLLEVGTGFHPELTGRENIFLNGAILGMSREEIRRKFDEIVAFAEVEKFLDTPVKRYSSGMYVRLAFSVAAHLEPEILLVDEVLAVGDSEFQNKCMNKMNRVAKEGRTIIFVSHNMASISNLCSHSILLRQGEVAAQGNTASVIDVYLESSSQRRMVNDDLTQYRPSWTQPYITSIRILDRIGNERSQFAMNSDVVIEMQFDTLGKITLNDPVMGVVINHSIRGEVGGINTRMTGFQAEAGGYQKARMHCTLESPHLLQGHYNVDVWLGEGPEDLDAVLGASHFTIEPTDIYATGRTPFESLGVMFLKAQWGISDT